MENSLQAMMVDTGSPSEITALVFTSDSKTLVSRDESGEVLLWDIIGETKK